MFAHERPEVERHHLGELQSRVVASQHQATSEKQAEIESHTPAANRKTSFAYRASASRRAEAFGKTKWQRLSGKVPLWGAMRVALALLALDLLVYFWPLADQHSPAGHQIEPKIAPHRPRPHFVGQLAINELLESAERLFLGQFHAPESMAWTDDKSAFYSGVEGGFIIRVEPARERWFVVARLNQRGQVIDESKSKPVQWIQVDQSERAGQAEDAASREQATQDGQPAFVPFCDRDVELYGERAEFEPAQVSLSRCSRPLGIRLAPSQRYLYVSDPFSGLYRVDLSPDGMWSERVTRLAEFGRRARSDLPGLPVRGPHEIMFADDLAVRWATQAARSDLIYLTDCSRKWSLRHLVGMMLEYDDSGRVLEFEVARRRMRALTSISPVRLNGLELDQRNLSFPNGLELTANQEALLISDLNNRRIIKHHLAGPLANSSEHLLWVPGYADNIRRGPIDGTYWTACGCAVDDGAWELVEVLNEWPHLRRLLLKWLQLSGSLLGTLGELLNWTGMRDLALIVSSAWLRVDPYCRHGLVLQFDESGQVLRSLHAPHFSSHFKLLSEAQQIEHANSSHLYLGSVYYSYLGRLRLH